MTGWWRDFGWAGLGRPATPRPIARPALLARLDSALDSASASTSDSALDSAQPVVSVVAGSGAGKSLLLSAWAAGRQAVMLQLRPEHADPRVLAADLAAQPGRPERGVVLDGVQGALPAGVAGLVGTVPLVLSGRDAIPGVRIGLGERDLAFAEDETYQVLGAALADAAAADRLAPDLHLLTNGWPALVGLAAAWLARLPAAERRNGMRQLGRAGGPLQEHLLAVLLAVLRPDEQELVRRLVHLPGVDAAIADALDLTEDLAGLPPLVQPVIGRAGFYGVPEPWQKTVKERLPLPDDTREALLRAYQGM